MVAFAPPCRDASLFRRKPWASKGFLSEGGKHSVNPFGLGLGGSRRTFPQAERLERRPSLIWTWPLCYDVSSACSVPTSAHA